MADEDCDNLQDGIQQEIDAWAALGHPALLQRFVLRNGKAYAWRPRIGPKLPAKLCFQNAALLALKGMGTYVEGLALRPGMGIIIHHAWLDVDGEAMDPTWEAAEDNQYFGVGIPTPMLQEELLRNGTYGLFDLGTRLNLELMLKIDPDLAQFFPKNFVLPAGAGP